MDTGYIQQTKSQKTGNNDGKSFETTEKNTKKHHNYHKP